MIRSAVKRLLGNKVLGVLDYFRFPDLRAGGSGPFNGQLKRQEMVRSLVAGLPIDAIVETGTFIGATTAFLATLKSIPVYTVEADERLYVFSWIRLRRLRKVTMLRGDSRDALRSLAEGGKLTGKIVLFYLDAHWGEDLPLAEELKIVFSNWEHAVVLIDDFQVPDDPGYQYDNYGPGKALTLEYTKPSQQEFGLNTFLPAVSSGEETGARRGCVLFIANAELTRQVENLSVLRRYKSLDVTG